MAASLLSIINSTAYLVLSPGINFLDAKMDTLHYKYSATRQSQSPVCMSAPITLPYFLARNVFKGPECEHDILIIITTEKLPLSEMIYLRNPARRYSTKKAPLFTITMLVASETPSLTVSSNLNPARQGSGLRLAAVVIRNSSILGSNITPMIRHVI
ncbi:uncharacterized protein EI90DRAFT_3077631, partial [Cantharellus anzutake]|uniref:uncharacterized protein n=1 Tax=Cantharellus anzutake TaxID=1750568 RepID=UPI001904801D